MTASAAEPKRLNPASFPQLNAMLKAGPRPVPRRHTLHERAPALPVDAMLARPAISSQRRRAPTVEHLAARHAAARAGHEPHLPTIVDDDKPDRSSAGKAPPTSAPASPAERDAIEQDIGVAGDRDDGHVSAKVSSTSTIGRDATAEGRGEVACNRAEIVPVLPIVALVRQLLDVFRQYFLWH